MSKQMNRQSGFTLVELAVVMIIIGLLIGGVLKGQELITNAQVTSTISQVKAFDAATSTFRDMYSALPGDIRNPGDRLPNCTAEGSCASTGDGNGHLGTGTGYDTPLTLPASGTESGRFFVHLSAADLLGGINPRGGQAWGGIMPEARIGGGFHVGSSSGLANQFVDNATGMRAGVYVTLTNNPSAVAGMTTGAISPNHAARIDAKLDDGLPASGSTRAFGTGCTATDADTGTVSFDEASSASVCGLHIRIQS